MYYAGRCADRDSSGRDVHEHHRIGADYSALTDPYVSQDSCAGTDRAPLLNYRTSTISTLPDSNGHALLDGYSFANKTSPDHDAVGMRMYIPGDIEASRDISDPLLRENLFHKIKAKIFMGEPSAYSALINRNFTTKLMPGYLRYRRVRSCAPRHE